jgi:Leucine-rich repeat (LRR) protein
MKTQYVITIVTIILILANGTFSDAEGAVPAAERATLIAFYNSTDGDNWNNNGGWKTPPLDVDGFSMPGTEDSWYGVTVESDTVTEISLNNNRLSGDIPSSISNLSSLNKLELENCGLGSLPPEIGNLSSLEELNLGDNNLTSLPPEIGNLSNLKMLNLTANRYHLISLPPEIGNLSSLEELDLGINDLASLPPEIGNLLNLKRLNLGNNYLASIPPEIGNLSSLTYLSIARNMLRSLPPEIGDLSSLNYLSLTLNELTSLPSEIGYLLNLTHLSLHGNRLTSLPPEIWDLSSLEALDIGLNQLTIIPPEIGDLTNLGNLRLHHNQLSNLPPEIGNLSSLEELDLGNNKLMKIPLEIRNLTNLQDNRCDFRWNALSPSNSMLIAFLNSKQSGGDWQSTQTVAPENFTSGIPEITSIPLSWTAIAYTSYTGGYEIYYSQTPGGPYTLFETTEDKTVETATVTGLAPYTDYYFIIRTVTYSQWHIQPPYSKDPDEVFGNQNTVYSEYTDEISGKTLNVDTDGDGIPDSQDGCPIDGSKTEPGVCGCGISDNDKDNDGTPNCNDDCDNDPNKTSPGICGCGVADTDTDSDGTPDCNDDCDNSKDTDGDGINDCDDGCPGDPQKINSGICGCGVADTDTDNDGTPNCKDNCDDDPNKTEIGICGCGIADVDTDEDGAVDCNDSDDDNDGISDLIEDSAPNDGDSNNDGILDSLQNNLAYFEAYNVPGAVFLESSKGTLSNCQAVENPSPDNTPVNIQFDYGFFDFTIADISAGGNVALTITLIDGKTPITYYKYGKTPDNQTDHWYEFLYDGVTGAEITGNVITLHFVDALRGDDILIQDSKVIDMGAPGFDITADDGGDGDGGGGGGGGCFIDTLRY